ncbi:MAG: hypothetical protein U1F68_20220 [Gammaproteobacteria bacterium]
MTLRLHRRYGRACIGNRRSRACIKTWKFPWFRCCSAERVGVRIDSELLRVRSHELAKRMLELEHGLINWRADFVQSGLAQAIAIHPVRQTEAANR